jgi:hypothetical protein
VTDQDKKPIIFTPENEPYLGQTLLFHLDQIICATMEQNAKVAPFSCSKKLTDPQQMASQVIPQAISLMLSIRELIRQGYLFGAHVLVRAFVERATILLYLHLYPDEIGCWNRGWEHRDAPSLARMFEAIQKNREPDETVRGWKLTSSMNSLLHAKPDSARWNLVWTEDGKLGHASSRILNRPELCDDLCANMISWVAVVQAMMTAYFGSDYAA